MKNDCLGFVILKKAIHTYVMYLFRFTNILIPQAVWIALTRGLAFTFTEINALFGNFSIKVTSVLEDFLKKTGFDLK